MPRNPGLPVGIALLAGVLLAPAPVPGAEVGLKRLGNPRMQVLTAKIAPPYSPNWNLSTGASSWPPLAGVKFLRETEKDTVGALYVFQLFNAQPFLENQGAAFANDSGSFLSWAEMKNQFSYQDHIGVFSFTLWSQSFRKDSVDATFKFTLTGARLYGMCMSTGSRAEFATDVSANDALGYFYQFHQDGGVRLYGNPPFPPFYNITNHGPMTLTDSNPDGIQRDREVVFARLPRTIDLSGVPLNSEFTVHMYEMTQANIAYDEVVKSYAYFRDPVDNSGGIEIEVSGLTPTDNPATPTVDVAPVAASGSASLSLPHPNPTGGAVSFSFETPEGGDFSLDVYDVSGRHVAGIANETFSAGIHALSWSGRDEGGTPAPAGVYFVRARGPRTDLVRRVVRIEP